MAHFKLYSVDISKMFGQEIGTFEYICAKKDNETKYTRLSGPMGGFDDFNLKCSCREDYNKASYAMEKLNKEYSNKDFTDKSELKEKVKALLNLYEKGKTQTPAETMTI